MKLLKYLLLFFPLISFSQQSKIDSLRTLLKTDKEDTNKVNHLDKLAFAVQFVSPDSTILLAQQGATLAQKINFKKGEANAYNNIGLGYSTKGDYMKALENYFKALKINEEINNKKGIAACFSYIGGAYDSQSDYPKALDYKIKAQKIAEELGDKIRIAGGLCNIGNIYWSQHDYPKTLDYYFKALKTAEEVGHKLFQANILNNIGTVYWRKKDYPKALDYGFKALKIFEELGNTNRIASALGNIGNVYEDQADYPKALDYFFQALKKHLEVGDKNGMAIVQSHIGTVYTSQKNYAEAEKYLLDALKLDKEIEAQDNERQTEESLSELYEQMGRFNLALEHYKKSIALKDTLFSQDNKKQLVQKEMTFEFEKKEALAKAEQEKKDAVVEEEKRRQKLFLFSVAGGLLLVLVFAGFIFRSLRITNKQKKIIEVKSKETEEQKHIIEEKNKDITDSINYARRIQRAMLPHRRDIWEAFPQSFVLFKPKDIVSGDFYFFAPALKGGKASGSYFIAAGDCTGHGVPGAFMSMVGAGKLTDSVALSSDTSEVLALLNIGVKTALKQSEEDQSATRDGMDIALCSVDTVNRVVKYAGANRPIWIIRRGATSVEEIKATKKAIGGFTENSQHFNTHEIKLQEGDTFYLSTDGYADTFGKDGKKMMTKRFKEILLSIQDKTMKEQEKYLDDFVENWKAGTEQVDDILVIGIRI